MSATGYQGSQRAGVTVTLYRNNGDGTFGTGITLAGTTATSATPAIMSCSVQSSLSQAASFSITFKRAGFADPLEAFPPDSWVDISFTEGKLSWHVLRGLTDEIRLGTGVAGAGATTNTYILVGRSFQKIYEDTPAYFNPYLGDREVSVELREALQDYGGDPATVQSALLISILQALTRRGRAVWAVPDSMPGVHDNFVSSASLVTSEFDLHGIPRLINTANIFGEGGPLWQLAQQYSDPMFCELFTELVPHGYGLQPIGVMDLDGTVGLPVGKSSMVTIFRDKPFVAVDPQIAPGPLGRAAPWFSLPNFVVPRQVLTSLDVGRSAYERFNAFFLRPSDPSISKFGRFRTPLWNTADQRAHGLRQMDVGLTYNFFEGRGAYQRQADSCIKASLRLVRDWYCMGGTLVSGTASLGLGAPWLRVGCRMTIQDASGHEPPLSAYIEGLAHQYTAGGGTQTSVSFTRGYVGSDADYLRQLTAASAAFTELDISPEGSPF